MESFENAANFAKTATKLIEAKFTKNLTLDYADIIAQISSACVCNSLREVRYMRVFENRVLRGKKQEGHGENHIMMNFIMYTPYSL
jgi:hypothetical protein